MQSLKEKNAIVTGAGKGIGRAIAISLAAEGVNVGLIARTETDLQSVAAQIQQIGVKVAIAVADVSDLQQVNTAVKAIQKAVGFIDILINNAGTYTPGKFMELTPERWEEIIKVNLLGTYYVTRALLPQMIAKQTGDIINIASSAGLRGSPDTSAYSASKFAVLGLTDSLMQEVRKYNIRVTALLPSTVVTPLAQAHNLINGDADKFMHPEDFAELVIAQLQLNRRVFIKDASIWATNP